jgi:8-oxo-dGTP diphosphatase
MTDTRPPKRTRPSKRARPSEPARPFEERPTIRVVAGAILRDGLLLAARRPLDSPSLLAGKWELPGGKVDAGESDQQALVRELREELDVLVEIGDWVGEVPMAQQARIIHLNAYLCHLLQGEPRAVEHAELRWLRRGDMETLDWAAADRVFATRLVHLVRD